MPPILTTKSFPALEDGLPELAPEAVLPPSVVGRGALPSVLAEEQASSSGIPSNGRTSLRIITRCYAGPIDFDQRVGKIADT